MSEAIRNTRSPDWNPVTFKITEETPDGPPAASVLITFGENPRYVAGGMSGQVQTSGPGVSPIARAWPISAWFTPGDYAFQIIRSWDQGTLAGIGGAQHRTGQPDHQTDRLPQRLHPSAYPCESDVHGLPISKRKSWQSRPRSRSNRFNAIRLDMELSPIDRAPDPSEQGRSRSCLNMNMAWRWSVTRSDPLRPVGRRWPRS